MNEKQLYKYAFRLALFTIIYNVLEALFALYFGAEDESLSLFGFGIDSLIEVISGLGIAHMVIRIQQNPDSNRDRFERTALRITGFSFYLFTAGLVLSAIVTFVEGHKPETTFWGIVISLVSIAFMWALMWSKTYVGKQLKSDAILADAACSKTCLYMSLVLLGSSGVYALTHWAFIDGVGAIGLAVFSLLEGRECFEKVKNNQLCGCGCSCKGE